MTQCTLNRLAPRARTTTTPPALKKKKPTTTRSFATSCSPKPFFLESHPHRRFLALPEPYENVVGVRFRKMARAGPGRGIAQWSIKEKKLRHSLFTTLIGNLTIFTIY